MSTDDDWPRIKAWRKALRGELIARREAVPVAQRREWNLAITGHLESGFAALATMTVGFCWPFKAEFDPLRAVRTFREGGARAALPAVVAKQHPLEFRLWQPGVQMVPGVYGIPVPDGTPVVAPDAAIVPMNGFDGQGYRLGYGGGYFDRTLAAARPRPLVIGVANEFARLPTIHPQPHDIAMDFVVTEAGIHVAGTTGLHRIDAAACAVQVQRLCDQRGLPHRLTTGGDQGSPSSPGPAD